MKSFVKVHLFPLRYAEQWKQRPKVDGVVAGGWGDGGGQRSVGTGFQFYEVKRVLGMAARQGECTQSH